MAEEEEEEDIIDRWLAVITIGSREGVAELLAVEPSLADAVIGGRTALHYAATGGHSEIISLLLAQNPSSVHSLTSHGETALHLAAGRGHEDVVAQLLAASPKLIGVISKSGNTPLQHGVLSGNKQVVAQLLGASPQSVAIANADGCTPLHLAASCGRDNAMAQMLAVCPQAADAMNNLGETALHLARGNAGVSELLLAADPQLIHAVDLAGNTILHKAMSRGSEELILKLCELNPSALHVANAYGQTAFEIAVSAAKRNARPDLGDSRILRMLQLRSPIDEILRAFGAHNMTIDPIKLLLERQCEELTNIYLNKDVVGTVYWYLGFVPPRKKKVTKKKTKNNNTNNCNSKKRLKTN